ncbi:MAG: methionine biosynthesis protein MetW [Candidatus Nealsonbacteria bacterium]
MALKQYFFRNRQEKLDIINANFTHLFSGKVLDVGCDDGYLKKIIKGNHTGIDKYGHPDILQDISSGLPFGSKSFETVAALDVLEHIDDIHFVFDELCRVSSKWVIVTLPNAFEWRFRLSFLFGKSVTGKYGLPAEPPSDRHRWIFSFEEARKFVEKEAQKNDFKISEEAAGYYRYNQFLPKMITGTGALFGKKFRNLFASHYLAILERI